MKNIIMFLAVITMLTVIGCSKGSCPLNGKNADASGIAAKIDGKPIYIGEIDAGLKDQMRKIDTDLYQIRKGKLDAIIEEKLIESAAKKSGKTKEEYFKSEIEDKIVKPTDKEIKTFFEAQANKNNDIKFENVKDRIGQYLVNTKMRQEKTNLVAKLKKESKVEVMLEAPKTEIDIKGQYFIGPKNAKITLVEFSDYECPFCKRVRPTIWKLVETYKDDLKYVFLDFPLSFHKESKKAHEASRCAGDQDKYFEFNKSIFNNQKKMSVKDLKLAAKELKLDTEKFNKCLDSGEHAKDVQANIQKGIEAGVSGTPAFFINGIMLSGAQPYESFVDIIESELNK